MVPWPEGRPVDWALVQARQAVREECEARPSLVQQPLPGMVEGYTPHFVGRRRELQRLLPGLRSGALQGVVLTGLGGVGKSVLATRLARKLERDAIGARAALKAAEIAALPIRDEPLPRRGARRNRRIAVDPGRLWHRHPCAHRAPIARCPL
jgi:Mrp family chromosome partitioning ATPase